MARTAITPQSLPTAYDTDGAAFTWTASDVVDKNSIALTGNEIILCRNVNSSATARTATITTVADSLGRTLTTSKSLDAGAYMVWPRFPLDGYLQADKTLHVEGDNAELEWAVLRLL